MFSLHMVINVVTMHSEPKLKKPVQIVDVTTQAVTETELYKVFAVMVQSPNTAAFILRGHGIVAMEHQAKIMMYARLLSKLTGHPIRGFSEKELEDLVHIQKGVGILTGEMPRIYE